MILRTSLSFALLLTAAPVLAQTAAPPATVPTEPRETIEGTLSQDRTVIAVPALATPAVTTVAGLRTDSLGRQIAEVIDDQVRSTGVSSRRQAQCHGGALSRQAVHADTAAVHRRNPVIFR